MASSSNKPKETQESKEAATQRKEIERLNLLLAFILYDQRKTKLKTTTKIEKIWVNILLINLKDILKFIKNIDSNPKINLDIYMNIIFSHHFVIMRKKDIEKEQIALSQQREPINKKIEALPEGLNHPLYQNIVKENQELDKILGLKFKEFIHFSTLLEKEITHVKKTWKETYLELFNEINEIKKDSSKLDSRFKDHLPQLFRKNLCQQLAAIANTIIKELITYQDTQEIETLRSIRIIGENLMQFQSLNGLDLLNYDKLRKLAFRAEKLLAVELQTQVPQSSREDQRRHTLMHAGLRSIQEEKKHPAKHEVSKKSHSRGKR